MNDSKYEFDSLDFERRGYFGSSSVPNDAQPPRHWERTPWYGWAFALARAKKGDFSALPNLIPLLDEDIGETFDRAVCILLGDAGFGDVFTRLKKIMKQREGYDLSFYAADAVADRGRLSDVPVLLDLHRATHDFSDIPSISRMVAHMLSPDGVLSRADDYGNVEEYCEMVERTWKKLADRFATTEVYLWQGEPTSVRRMAKSIIRKAKEPYFSSALRRKFEAATGINCSGFYKEGQVFQPLSAAAIAEDFLSSLHADQFVEGVRYFFGHPLPD